VCGTDLSLFHEPVTSTFTASVREEAAGPAADRARSFFENGFVTGVRLLNDEQIEELRRSLAELMNPQLVTDPRFYEYHLNESGDPAKVLFHALGAWRVSPALHDVIFLRPMVRVAEQLLGGPVRFWMACRPFRRVAGLKAGFSRCCRVNFLTTRLANAASQRA